MAKKRKPLKQLAMLTAITETALTPNQYYILCCIRDSVKKIYFDPKECLTVLVKNKWITEERVLTPKAVSLIETIEKMYSAKKAVTLAQLMGADFKDKIKVYVDMFPNIKLPSGKAARSATGNLEKNFKWFFESYSYDWETILKATAHYINDQQTKQWKYCRTSQYFIRKDNMSDLADYCNIILTGGDEEEKPKHAVKVV